MMIWPYYVSQGSSKGDLLIAFVFLHFHFFFSSPIKIHERYSKCSLEGLGRVTAHESEDPAGQSEGSSLTQTCERREPGLGCWTRASASTKDSVTSPSFMGGI